MFSFDVYWDTLFAYITFVNRIVELTGDVSLFAEEYNAVVDEVYRVFQPITVKE